MGRYDCINFFCAHIIEQQKVEYFLYIYSLHRQKSAFRKRARFFLEILLCFGKIFLEKLFCFGKMFIFNNSKRKKFLKSVFA